MKNITLISDWKLRDPYVAMFKGQLLKAIPDANIIDITHAIDSFSIEQTAFILKNSYASFPEQTIHIILTGTTLSHHTLPVMVEYDNHYFVGEDNGVFSLMFTPEEQINAVQFNQEDPETSILDKCVQMVNALWNKKLKNQVTPYQQFVKKLQFLPENDTNRKIITGQVTYIDTCCNAITNIPVGLFNESVRNGHFSATLSSSKHITITHHHTFYNPQENEVYLLSNRLGFLELTLNNSRLAVIADIHIGDKVEIQY
ncbi:MAG: SAM-dependent chlorinase/fluorinase [Bacteroidales bacterium]|nr:SAM-dependent chlorinase/fluorinase [Bacteroidales bacterium]